MGFRRRSSTQCGTSEGATSCGRLNPKVRRRLACRETEYDALLSERKNFAEEYFDSGHRHHTVVSPAQSKDGLRTDFLRAARAQEEEFDAMRHERRSDIMLPSQSQGSQKACLSRDGDMSEEEELNATSAS